jgi:hypothetical protein
MANENILESIDRLYSDRQMVGRACNYLIMSEAIYKVFRMEVLKQTGERVDTYRQIMEYKGMVVIRLDRDDYTLLIG